ncbi:MAG: serpin family protein [Saprospiraceae bacterium]
MKNHVGVFLIAIYILSLSACKTEEKQNNEFLDASAEQFEESLIKFGFNQFIEMSNSEDKNVIISPLSIATALYITINGANNNTLIEMKEVLFLDSIYPSHNALYREFIDGVLLQSENLQTESKVFCDPDKLELDNDFIENCDKYYEAEVQHLNFSSQEALTTINDWVSDVTEERIPEVLENINSDDVMFLINALYFKGDWDNGFPVQATELRDFTLRTDEKIQVNMMSNDTEYKFAINDEYCAVEMPFRDSIFSMTFILPSKEETTKNFINKFNSDSFLKFYLNLNSEMKNERLLFGLPKMELKTKYMLKTTLMNLGMNDAFKSGNADFSNFGKSSGNLFLTKVLHDVFIKIDEQGVEGAAATTVGVGVTSIPPTILLNRPFIFILKHIDSNVPVFIGEISNPLEN